MDAITLVDLTLYYTLSTWAALTQWFNNNYDKIVVSIGALLVFFTAIWYIHKQGKGEWRMPRQRTHEVSEFVRSGFHWFLVDAKMRNKITDKEYKRLVRHYDLLDVTKHPSEVKKSIRARLKNGLHKPVSIPGQQKEEPAKKKNGFVKVPKAA